MVLSVVNKVLRANLSYFEIVLKKAVSNLNLLILGLFDFQRYLNE